MTRPIQRRQRRQRQRGASAVEYALLIAGIAALLIVSIGLLGTGTLGLFDDTCESIAAQDGSTC